MLHIVLLHLGPHILSHRIAADFPESKLRDEFRGLAGHHDMDFGSCLPQAAHHFHSLVSGNAPGDPYHDFLALQ